MDYEIDASWVAQVSQEKMIFVLKEFRYYFHRFAPSLALIIGNASNESVRKLLISNLVEECGSADGKPSHLNLLDSLLVSCGIDCSNGYEPTSTTRKVEEWFFDIYNSTNTHRSLCVLGLATESVSASFLKVMLSATKRLFSERDLDLTYFDAHLSIMEEEHVQAILKAIEIVEHDQAISASSRKVVVSEAISMHQEFWDNLKRY